MSTVKNFRDFYKSHSKTFRFFGVVPMIRRQNALGEYVTSRLQQVVMLAIFAFLAVYWTGVTFTFLVEKHLNDKISIISNWIQMLGNSIALTTTLGISALKYADFENIITQFHRIDENLEKIGHKVDYASHCPQVDEVVDEIRHGSPPRESG